MIADQSPELTPEMREVVELVVAGLTDQAIARRLRIGTATVQRRVRAAAEALGVRSRVELAVRAVSTGVVRLPEASGPAVDGDSDAN